MRAVALGKRVHARLSLKRHGINSNAVPPLSGRLLSTLGLPEGQPAARETTNVHKSSFASSAAGVSAKQLTATSQQPSKVFIIPTVLSRSKEEFEQRLARLLPYAHSLQVDFADGKFVPSKCVPLHDVPDLHQYTKHDSHRFEAHLMVEHPGAYIRECARRGFMRVIVHIEPLTHGTFENVLWQCQKHGLELYLAIKPESSVHRLVTFLQEDHSTHSRGASRSSFVHGADQQHVAVPASAGSEVGATSHSGMNHVRDGVHGVLFMGVHPGFNGAPYVPQIPNHIQTFMHEAKRCGLALRTSTGAPFPIQVDGGMNPDTIGLVVAAGATRINSGSFVSNAPDVRLALRELQSRADEALLRSTSAARETSRDNDTKTFPIQHRRQLRKTRAGRAVVSAKNTKSGSSATRKKVRQ